MKLSNVTKRVVAYAQTNALFAIIINTGIYPQVTQFTLQS